MNVLFLTLSSFKSITERGIYSDLMRKIIHEGHYVYVVTPVERRFKQNSSLYNEKGCNILSVRTLNIQKTNIVEKGIGTLLIEHQFKSAIKKFLKYFKFDLVIYSTPPITFLHVVKYIKHRDNARTYLLLKDIFPQNAVDLKLIRKGGIIHRYFRHKESELYSISDNIGCMSPANSDYLIKHNPGLDHTKVHVNPNSIEITDKKSYTISERNTIRAKYGIPQNTTVFIYGGNLGKPQGIGFLIEIIEFFLNSDDTYFAIIGSGTEFKLVSDWISFHKPLNVLVLPFIPKVQFDELLAASDVGLIFLDPRFTIPNFPSRLLSYLEFSLPVIAATDLNSDIGKIAQEQEFGFWCEAGDLKSFWKYAVMLKNNDELRLKMGMNGYRYLKLKYSVDESYSIIFEK